MLTITIRTQDGELVRQFTTDSPDFADEHIAMWQKRFNGQTLDVTTSEE